MTEAPAAVLRPMPCGAQRLPAPRPAVASERVPGRPDWPEHVFGKSGRMEP
jgi:hypothetical protein